MVHRVPPLGVALSSGEVRMGTHEGFDVPQVPALMRRNIAKPLPEGDAGVAPLQVGHGAPQAAQIQPFGPLDAGEQAILLGHELRDSRLDLQIRRGLIPRQCLYLRPVRGLQDSDVPLAKPAMAVGRTAGDPLGQAAIDQAFDDRDLLPAFPVQMVEILPDRPLCRVRAPVEGGRPDPIDEFVDPALDLLVLPG